MDLRNPQGHYLLKPLFYEQSTPEMRKSFTPLYTFKEHDHVGQEGNVYKSIYQIYMGCQDEYEAAIKIVGSLYHWDKLCDCTWFMNGFHTYMGLKDWREHKRRERESLALTQLIAQAEEGNVTAIRYLHTNELSKKTKKRGPKGNATRDTHEEELKDNIAIFTSRKRGND